MHAARRLVPAFAVAVAVVLAAGCGDGSQADDAGPGTTTAASAPRATPSVPDITAPTRRLPGPPPRTIPVAATTASPPAVPGRRVAFRASDGARTSGILRGTAGSRRAPAIVLLHQSDGGAEQWDAWAPVLRAAGFRTLAVRGRGGRLVPPLAAEARGALRYLRGRRDVDPGRLAVVGASIGADAAVFTRATAPVAATVALSPGADLDLLDRLEGAGAREATDVLVLSDDSEADAAAQVAADAPGSKRLVAAVGGHGVGLLDDAGVSRAVLAWLRARLG